MANKQFERDALDAQLAILDEHIKECGLDIGGTALSTAVAVEAPHTTPEPTGYTAEAVEFYKQFVYPKPIH